MESSNDFGLRWRQDYQELIDQFLDAHAIIPNDGEYIMRPRGKDISTLKEPNPEEYKRIMRRYIELDLALIDMSDLVIAKWDGEMSTGTISEIHHCYMTSKPVYLVSKKEFHELPGWTASQIGKENIFPKIACLLGHLTELKYGV